MTDNTYHAVEGSAAKITESAKDDEPFNPRLFHRGMTDLQEYILTINQSAYADWPIEPDTDDNPTHDFDREGSAITVEEDTALDIVTNAIPTGWDGSILVDSNDSYDGWYILVMCLRCGDGVNIWVKTKITNYHHIDEVTIETTDITDRSNTLSIQDISIKASAQTIAKLMRNTTRMISIGYTHAISSGIKAFDYSMTFRKPSNYMSNCNIAPISQNYWSDVRDVTRQTITNNRSEARDDLHKAGVEDLHGDPIRELSAEQNHALEYTDSKEDAYVRLV